jgi:glycosyltransferase involved in cell wall biosynthesis
MGGVWNHPNPPINIVVWSEAMRGRGLRGASDYENSPDLGMGSPPMGPIKDAHVAYGGINTDWYTPTYEKEGFFLWMNRWHMAKGYRLAIELARTTGIELVMAGEHPDRELHEYQRGCANEAQQMAADLPNVRFEWLPADPDHHDAKRELYRRAKALLYTVQFQEPFGLSQAESLACGTPVIGTRFGSVPEVIEDGLTGYVRSDSIEDLATAVKLIDGIDPKVCRNRAVERFDRHVMAASYLKEYQAVIDGKTWGE